MGIIQSFERRLQGAVGNTFARLFGGSVHPSEVINAMQAEAGSHLDHQGGRTIAPNRFTVRLGPTDRKGSNLAALAGGDVKPVRCDGAAVLVSSCALASAWIALITSLGCTDPPNSRAKVLPTAPWSLVEALDDPIVTSSVLVLRLTFSVRAAPVPAAGSFCGTHLPGRGAGANPTQDVCPPVRLCERPWHDCDLHSWVPGSGGGSKGFVTVWVRARAGDSLVRSLGRVAKWQTRTVQVRVSERTWGFNSPLAHSG